MTPGRTGAQRRRRFALIGATLLTVCLIGLSAIGNTSAMPAATDEFPSWAESLTDA